MPRGTSKTCICSGKRQDILEAPETPKTPKSPISSSASAGTTSRTASRPATQASMASQTPQTETTSKQCSACEKFITDLTFKFREAWMREDLALQFQLVTAVPDLLTRDEVGLDELARRFRCNVGFIKLAQVQRRDVGPLTYPEVAVARTPPKVAFAESIREEEEEPVPEVDLAPPPLDGEVVRKVLLFYWDHSRSIPPNTAILATPDGDNSAINRRVVQFETPEAAWAKFLEQHEDGLGINFEAFKDLKLSNLIWPLKTPFECTTTACKIHENFKLILEAGNIEDSMDDVLKKILCKPSDDDCALFDCVNLDCPKQFTDVYAAPSTGDITLKQWQKYNGKHRLEEEMFKGHEYAGIFESALRAFAPHDFLAKVQEKYVGEHAFKEGVVVVYCGAGKECSFGRTIVTIQSFQVVLQNGRVAFFVVGSDAKLEVQAQKSWAFHAFRSKVIEDIKSREIGPVTKYIYVSDVKKQYRNWTNAANLANHEVDFGVQGEWVFMPKGHFKAECDAMDLLTIQSLQKEQPQESGNFENEAPGNALSEFMNARNQVDTEGRVQHFFVSEDEIEGTKIKLESRRFWSESQGKLNGLLKSHFWNVEEKSILETSKKYIVFKKHVQAAMEILAIPLD